MTIRNTLLLLTAALPGACKDKDAFTIKGEVSHAGQLKKVYLLAADSAGVKLLDSTNLSEDSAFRFKGMTTYPNLYKLRIGGFIFDLIALNGDVISFRTDLKDPGHASSISGSAASLELQEWDRLNDDYAAKSQALLERYQAELQRSPKKEDSLLKAYTAPYRQIAGELEAKTWAFAMDHRTSLAGFYAATSLDHKKYEAQLIRYANAISFNWQKAIDSDRLDWTQVSDQARFDGAAEKLYHIEEIPSNFIIDPEGVIIAKNLYGAELAAFLDRTFAEKRLPKS